VKIGGVTEDLIESRITMMTVERVEMAHGPHNVVTKLSAGMLELILILRISSSMIEWREKYYIVIIRVLLNDVRVTF